MKIVTNKKGLSAVIASILLILFSAIGIAIVWGITSDFFNKESKGLNSSTEGFVVQKGYRGAIERNVPSGSSSSSSGSPAPQNTPAKDPIVSITNPQNGNTVMLNMGQNYVITLSVEVDQTATLQKLELFVNGAIADTSADIGKKEITWKNVQFTKGNQYTLIAKATDNLGKIGNSSPITITLTTPSACQDSDGGKTPETFGQIRINGALRFSDNCWSSGSGKKYLYEYYCLGDLPKCQMYSCSSCPDSTDVCADPTNPASCS